MGIEASEDPAQRALIPAEKDKPALRAAWSQMSDVAGSEDALKSAMASGIPLRLWAGKEDIFYAKAKAVAATLGCSFLDVDGDHQLARRGNLAAINGVIAFLVEVRENSPAAKL